MVNQNFESARDFWLMNQSFLLSSLSHVESEENYVTILYYVVLSLLPVEAGVFDRLGSAMLYQRVV